MKWVIKCTSCYCSSCVFLDFNFLIGPMESSCRGHSQHKCVVWSCGTNRTFTRGGRTWWQRNTGITIPFDLITFNEFISRSEWDNLATKLFHYHFSVCWQTEHRGTTVKRCRVELAFTCHSWLLRLAGIVLDWHRAGQMYFLKLKRGKICISI